MVKSEIVPSISYSSSSDDEQLSLDDDDILERTRTIGFDSVTVTTFDYELGDSPAVTQGCPIRLGDKPLHTESCDLETYELVKKTEKSNRKKSSKKRSRKTRTTVLGVSDRAQLLMERGYTMDQIVQGTMAADVIRNERKESLKASGWEKFADALATGRGKLPQDTIRNVLKGGKSTTEKMSGLLMNTGKAVTSFPGSILRKFPKSGNGSRLTLTSKTA